ncbi:MAG: PBP1A family penicillin-binding protein [Deltaproteobacteria bacterium]|jgi:penicillin-binding protein 1A|nr:PBP1A family penicillin-binding protein [Deltaproteobacteria bacterium]
MPIFHLHKRKLFIILFLIAGALCGCLAGAFFALTHDLPQIRALEHFKPDAVTRIYSADRVLLAELFVEKREPVPLETIPRYLVAALVATEDRKFYKHSGVDLKGIARAIIKDIKAGEFVEGASTITQQLAKTLFLTPRKTLVRKLKEAILSFQLERRYTKDEILELYLNQVYFGSGAYGVESAAKIFFGKPVKDLNLAECALVAGMPKSPSRYSPLVNPELAIQRRNTVLRQMRDTGIISGAVYHQAKNEALGTDNRRSGPLQAPYFVEYIKSTLEDELGSTRLYKSGLSIYTTLNFQLQQAAEKAITDGLADLAGRIQPDQTEDDGPQAALISIDLTTGAILAMVGGNDFATSRFNRATMALRQPGSAFKPFVYAYAIEQGLAQNKTILDAPVVYKGAQEGQDWKPENFSSGYKGEMTLRHALAISQNIPAVRLLQTLGPMSVAQFAHQLGIKSPLTSNLSLALGTSEVTLLELTAAYAVFPNKGERIEPYGILEVSDRQGRIIWRTKPKKRLVLSRSAAAIVTNMLEGVVKEGTGRRAQVLGKAVAGKTGTSNDYKDALFVGFSPRIIAGVWVGRDRGGSLGKRETGARAALPIWIDFMQVALQNEPHLYFDIPDDVRPIRIDPLSGLPQADDAKQSVVALFKKGSEPKPLQ